MPTHGAESNGGLGSAAKRVSEHASAIARLELRLAAVELKRKGIALGLGIGLGAGAAVLGLFALGFAFATAAAALATVLSTWLALLIVTASLGFLAATLGLLAIASLKRGTPPVPDQAIKEARRTAEALRR